MVLEKTLESPLDCKEIKPVNCKGNLSWIFIGRTDAEAEAPILWPPDVKCWLIRKDPDVGKIKGRGEGDDRGWDGWMASLTQWTWVWPKPGRWWRTGNPGMLQSMGSLRVRHNWATTANILVERKRSLPLLCLSSQLSSLSLFPWHSYHICLLQFLGLSKPCLTLRSYLLLFLLLQTPSCQCSHH